MSGHTHYSLFRGNETVADYEPLPAGGLDEVFSGLPPITKTGEVLECGQQAFKCGEYTVIAMTGESLRAWLAEHESVGNPAASIVRAAIAKAEGH